MTEHDSNSDDLRVFAQGVTELLTGCENAVRTMRAHVVGWEGDRRPSPVELHKTKRELDHTLSELADGKEAMATLIGTVERVAEPAQQVSDEPLPRHNESLANGTIRSQMLTELASMDEAIAAMRGGLQKASQMVGAMAAGGRTPPRQVLTEAHRGLKSGVAGAEQLGALVTAFRQRVEWFDAKRVDAADENSR